MNLHFVEACYRCASLKSMSRAAQKLFRATVVGSRRLVCAERFRAAGIQKGATPKRRRLVEP